MSAHGGRIPSDWGHKDCAICGDEALRRAWLDAGYRVRPESGDAAAGRLAHWRAWVREDYPASARSRPTVRYRPPVDAYVFGALCWAIIAAIVWLVWQAF